MTIVLPYHSRVLTHKAPLSIFMVMNFKAKITFQKRFSLKVRSIEFIVIRLINDLQLHCQEQCAMIPHIEQINKSW